MQKLLAIVLSIGVGITLLALSINSTTTPDETTKETLTLQSTADRIEAASESTSRSYTRTNLRTADLPNTGKKSASSLHVKIKDLKGAQSALEARIAKDQRQAERQAAREAAAQQQQQQQAAPASPAPAPASAPSGGGCSGLPADLAMVCQHESGGNPRAYNATGCVGGCYGLFQMAGAYMGTWAERAGYPGYGPGFWPVEVQKAVALHMYSQPNGLEVYWCQWTTYC